MYLILAKSWGGNGIATHIPALGLTHIPALGLTLGALVRQAVPVLQEGAYMPIELLDVNFHLIGAPSFMLYRGAGRMRHSGDWDEFSDSWMPPLDDGTFDDVPF